MELTLGMKGIARTTVTPNNTADAVGSGLVPVFATPYMIALMEGAAVNAIQPALAEGQGSVGTQVSVSHDAATPIGMDVWAEATVTEINGKAISFTVEAFDSAGSIGKGTHNRYIIQVDRFLAKAQAKAAE